MVNVMTKVRVLRKWSKDVTKDDGTKVTYYNVKVADPVEYDSEILSVTKELYDSLHEEQDVCIYGSINRFGMRTVVQFTELFNSKKHFTW